MKFQRKYLVFILIAAILLGVFLLDAQNSIEKLILEYDSAIQEGINQVGKIGSFYISNSVINLSLHTNLGMDVQNDLEELVLEHDSVTQKDIDKIGKMSSLKKLEFHVQGSDIDLSPLTNLNNLEELCIISGRGEDDLDTTVLGNLKQIKRITLVECDFDTSFLAQLTNLESVLFLKCTNVKDLSAFENLKSLQDISISYVDDTDLKYLKNLIELKEIDIAGANIRNFDGLKNLINVEELHLRECRSEFEDQIINMDVFVNMHKLTNILIEDKKIEDISPLAEVEGLEMITLVGTGVSDISPLANLKNLRDLAITGNRSEYVEEQAEKLFPNVERVFISEKVFFNN